MSYEGQIDVNKTLISRGVYKLKDGDTIEIGYPLKESSPRVTISDPMLKIQAEPYDDTGSTDATIGMSLDTISAKPTSTDDQNLKRDWINRDLGIAFEGEVKLYNMKSGFTAYPQTKIAPYPSGFTEWTSGMNLWGEALEIIPYQKKGKCLIKRRMEIS